MISKTHYPDYDVLKEKDHWDPHTRDIVLSRLNVPEKLNFFSEEEAEKIKIIAQHLVYENKDQILNYIVFHLDTKLKGGIGESDRKAGIPKEDQLIRDGLQFLERASLNEYGESFNVLGTKEQFQLISMMQHGQIKLPEWSKDLQKEVFKKLLTEIVSSYYSHPDVWSQIGYGGPAYPRGYVRVELGLTDPWEAKRNES